MEIKQTNKQGKTVFEAIVRVKFTFGKNKEIVREVISGHRAYENPATTEADAAKSALSKAFKEDKQVLVEEFIEGREFTIGIVKMNKQIKTLPATEIVSSKEFFDFEAKYTTGITEEITPGRMTDEEKERVEKAMIDIYQRLNCAGVVRIDYILESNTNNMYVLEVNTVPGQSQNSIIPQQVRAMGGNMTDFYGALLDEILVK
jgi:D-alanine-D-alanine ligase